jgi:hypothetical protein
VTQRTRRNRESGAVAVRKRLLRLAKVGSRRIVSICLIGVFLTGTSGVPLKTRAVKDRSSPFPCQDNPCGCLSAEECWHHCCCHTNRQKVDWAREHGVAPPDFVIAAAEKEEHEQSACCHHGHCPKCAAALAENDNDEDIAPVATAPQAKAPNNSFRTVLVITDLARRCAGLPFVWSVLSSALPVRIDTFWSFDTRLVGHVVEPASSVTAVDLTPPVPPPKLAALCG